MLPQIMWLTGLQGATTIPKRVQDLQIYKSFKLFRLILIEKIFQMIE